MLKELSVLNTFYEIIYSLTFIVRGSKKFIARIDKILVLKNSKINKAASLIFEILRKM